VGIQDEVEAHQAVDAGVAVVVAVDLPFLHLTSNLLHAKNNFATRSF
jgi:hypothetical protein